MYHILFMFGKTQFYSPLLHLIRVKIVRMSMQDYVQMKPESLSSVWCCMAVV